MNERGIPVKEEEIDAMIEQAVLSFKNSTK